MARLACPSCGRAREVPEDRIPARTFAQRCPGCGTRFEADGALLRTLANAPVPPGAADPPDPSAEADGARGSRFPAPTGGAAAALAAGTVLLLWSQLTHGLLASVIDGASLLFHEAGHPIFGLFGSRFLMFLGGTLGQLAFPVTAAIVFSSRRQTASFAAAVVWIGVNLVHVGRYAADAEARVLPLLAADEDAHDWWNLLGMMNLRHRATLVGGAIAAAGWAAQVLAPAWAAWRWFSARGSGALRAGG
ncbi:MAG TPA: zinc-ribbon domain-containing protein [Anaeromyxobacteraceae bacterium]|nr:zinc-ribbon domain-containing protein [Anaeromyxobacteraceae bacterium]